METININIIYKKYYSKVYAFIRRYMDSKFNAESCEELTNNVFIRVNQHINKFDIEKASLYTWICHIAKNIVIDYGRREQALYNKMIKRYDAYDNNSQYTSIPCDNVPKIDRTTKILIKKALYMLTEDERKVIIESFYHEKKQKDIAESLGLTLSNVKVIEHRAKKKLSKILVNECTI